VNKAGRANARVVRAGCIALLYWFGAGGAPALAAYDVGGGFALSHDSNITAGSSVSPNCLNPPCADWTEQLFGGLGYEEHNAELNARLVTQAQIRHFAHNTYQDDKGYFLDGAAVWMILPQQFSWFFQDTFQEVMVNLQVPDTPANRARTNSLSTGPEFTFRVGPADSPVIGDRYGRFYIANNPGSNERNTIYARWLHKISALSTLSLNFEATRIHFDSTSTASYTDLSRQDSFFRFDRLSRYSQNTFDFGNSRLQPYGGQELKGRLVRYLGQWWPTPESALRITLVDQVSDAYSDMIRSVINPITLTSVQADAPALPVSVAGATAGDVYHSRRGELASLNRGVLFGYSLQAWVRRVDYLNATAAGLDYDETAGKFSLSWFLSVEAQVYALAQYAKRTFPNVSPAGEQDIDRSASVGMIYKLGRSLTLSVDAGQTERQSNVQTPYVDRHITLVLGYSTGPLFTPRPQR